MSEMVDLFTASARAWLRTGRGVWFLPAGDRVVFLAPAEEPGRYLVARAPMNAPGGEFVSEPLDLSMAMSWGEQYASETAVLNRRQAPWRRDVPKPAQLAKAAQLGVAAAGLSRGELSDAISTALVNQRVDSMPCVSTVHDGGYW